MFRKFVCVLGLIQLTAGPAFAAEPDIGTAVAVKNEVKLESGGIPQPLVTGSVVHQDEVIVTGAAAGAEVELLDKTKLAVGPEARIVLDKFVYDASAATGSISITLSKGAFRFLTGLAPKQSYEIKTPTASLGVRGTIFDVYVGNKGETAVLLHEGAVQTCSLAGACQMQEKEGTILFVTADGFITQHSRCDHSYLRGIGFEKAFPFVGNSLKVDPIRRMSLHDFECGPRNNPSITPTHAAVEPSAGPQSPSGQGLTLPDALGFAVVGGLVIGLPIAESHPASP